MLGAIIGDIVGSIYEFNNIKTKEFPLFGEGCKFTDDTVMTLAVAQALMDGARPIDYINAMKIFGKKYPKAGYGDGFRNWLRSETLEPYNSKEFYMKINWEDKEISISNEAQLREFATLINSGEKDFNDCVITLADNIEISGGEWIAIGTPEHSFKGEFDGNGKIIRGVYINQPDKNYQGLFGYSQGKIKNLGLVESKIIGKNYVGGLAGYNVMGEIRRCYTVVDVIGDSAVGGLLGKQEFGFVKNSYSSGNIEGNHFLAGGLIGINCGECAIINSCFFGKVAYSYGVELIGDLAGVNAGEIKNCYALKRTLGKSPFLYLNSFVAEEENGKIKVEEELTEEDIENDLVGGSGIYPEIINSELKSEYEMKQQNTYIDWDFNCVWKIDPNINNGFPYLR